MSRLNYFAVMYLCTTEGDVKKIEWAVVVLFIRQKRITNWDCHKLNEKEKKRRNLNAEKCYFSFFIGNYFD